MLTIMQQDIKNLIKNKPIMMYLILYPLILILITGFVCSSIFSNDILSSYDYYGVTMMIYLSMATVIILPELLFGSHVKFANYRIVYAPIDRTKIYLSKLIVSIGFSYIILSIYMLMFNALDLVNYGGTRVGSLLILDLAVITFSTTFGGAFCLLLKNEDLSTKLLNILINILAIISGLFVPMYIFGKKIANISNMSPIAKVMSSFFGIIYDNNFNQLFTTIEILLLFSAIFLVIIHLMYHPEKFKM
ncbi:ABC transporter permease [Bombilactobacillus bombi]|uniref:ABC transporter permease n=1 Tax=Bombilactobacillus bombi TaxID=1303590 RepID=UPI0015E5D41C|nr:ABC transporter permease [Bombilactobacillus bombi]MBA1435239.1 ABC transporter permease [Bombilactobacillus bombi]